MSAPFLARELYAQHRQRALAALPEGEAILLFGAAPKGRNGDSEHRYRQDSHLLYLTGWTDPEVVVMLRGGEAPNFVMFVQPKDAVMEVWTGIRPGPEGATTLYGADEAHPIAELAKRLPFRVSIPLPPSRMLAAALPVRMLSSSLPVRLKATVLVRVPFSTLAARV